MGPQSSGYPSSYCRDLRYDSLRTQDDGTHQDRSSLQGKESRQARQEKARISEESQKLNKQDDARLCARFPQNVVLRSNTRIRRERLQLSTAEAASSQTIGVCFPA